MVVSQFCRFVCDTVLTVSNPMSGLTTSLDGGITFCRLICDTVLTVTICLVGLFVKCWYHIFVVLLVM